jgi:phosphopantetheine binding protein
MQPESTSPLQPLASGEASDDVMRQFQQLMSQFLQTQALVMTTYLQGAPAAGSIVAAPRALAPSPAVPARVAAPAAPVVAPVAAAPVQAPAPVVARAAVMAEAAAVPVHPAPAPAVVPAPPVAAPPVAAHRDPAPIARPPAGLAAADVLGQLLQIVADRTGYPQEMLDVDANIEADLGIDSIKRMEILTAFQQLHAGAQRGAFQNAMEKLTSVKTLRETATALGDLLASQAEPAVA